jgi:uncharacterized membrane protein YbhN (UPF0104 family)
MRALARFPTRNTWVVVAKIAVSIALLAIVLRNVDFNGVAAVLVRIPVSTVAAAVILIALQTCVQGLRWWLVMSALSSQMGLARVAQLTFVGVFFNQVLDQFRRRRRTGLARSPQRRPGSLGDQECSA